MKKKSISTTPMAGQSIISGVVSFIGIAPPPRTFSVASDRACFAGGDEWRESEEVIINSAGAVKNVFVYISQGMDSLEFAPVLTPVTLDQQGCRFAPRVLGIQVGQPLRIVNSDKTFHNVHAQAKSNKPFNLGMTIKTLEAQRVFDVPEVMIPIRCNVHPWMGAYIGVVDHPFYSVTDSAGCFSLPNLRAGHYTIEAWHEELGKLSQDLSIGEAENRNADFLFHGKEK